MRIRLIIALMLIAAVAVGVTISVAHYGIGRTAVNSEEQLLTPTNAPNLLKLGSYAVDGAVYAQPLYLTGVTISGAVFNVLLVATMHCTVYAFDASKPGSAALWSTHLCSPRTTSLPVVLYAGELGCLSTPAADMALGFVFLNCGKSDLTYGLYKVNISTGAIASSTTITATASGTGDPGTQQTPWDTAATEADTVSGGVVTFYPKYQINRMAVTLSSGNVVVGFGSAFGQHPWHGWLMAYAESNLAQVGSFCTSPNSWGNGIWQAASGPVVDDAGNLWLATGDGGYNGSTDFDNTVLKLSPSLVLLDWYTPTNHAALTTADQDLGMQLMRIPGTSWLTWGSKDYNVYLLNMACPGKLGGTVGGCAAPQIFGTGTVVDNGHAGIYGGVFMNNAGYFANTAGAIYKFAFTGSAYNTTPTTLGTYAFPGAMMAGSINGSSNGIIFAVTVSADSIATARAGTLRAINAATLTEVWNSDSAGGGRDTLGTASKFAIPTVANGKVYVGDLDHQVMVYGLLNSSALGGAVALRGKAVIR